MRNSRKKRKRQNRSKEKRELIVGDAIREVRALADQHKTQASKYRRLWKHSVEANNQLKQLLGNVSVNNKV